MLASLPGSKLQLHPHLDHPLTHLYLVQPLILVLTDRRSRCIISAFPWASTTSLLLNDRHIFTEQIVLRLPEQPAQEDGGGARQHDHAWDSSTPPYPDYMWISSRSASFSLSPLTAGECFCFSSLTQASKFIFFHRQEDVQTPHTSSCRTKARGWCWTWPG